MSHNLQNNFSPDFCLRIIVAYWTLLSIRSAERYLEHGRLSQNLNIGLSLNFADSKMGTRVAYCESLNEFLFAKFEISLETQEKFSKSVNSTV